MGLILCEVLNDSAETSVQAKIICRFGFRDFVGVKATGETSNCLAKAMSLRYCSVYQLHFLRSHVAIVRSGSHRSHSNWAKWATKWAKPNPHL
jgi:hypothetical protein